MCQDSAAGPSPGQNSIVDVKVAEPLSAPVWANMILPSSRWLVVGARLRRRALLCRPPQPTYLAGLSGRSVEARGGRAQPAVNRVLLANTPMTVSRISITSFESES